MLTRRSCAKLLAALAAGSLRASAQSESSVIRVDVDLVNVFFAVRKAHSGELAPGLNKDDFVVLEDGKPQEIAHFSRESNLPLELGLLIDVSGSQANLIETEREAGSSFFSNVIHPSDEAFLLAFGRDTVLIQDFTNSVPRLKAGLNGLKADSHPTGGQGLGGSSRGGSRVGGFPFPGGGGGGRHPGGRFPGGGGGPRPDSSGQTHKGTLLFDAVYLSCTDEINRKSGRKALILITDGDDRGSYYNRDQAIETAQRADTIVYSIYYADPKLAKRRGERDAGHGLDDLQAMSDETGGRVFKVGTNHVLEDIFTELQAEMRSQYSIGYKSSNPDRNGEFRRVEIRTKTAGFEVQSRKGYFATRNRVT